MKLKVSYAKIGSNGMEYPCWVKWKDKNESCVLFFNDDMTKFNLMDFVDISLIRDTNEEVDA